MVERDLSQSHLRCSLSIADEHESLGRSWNALMSLGEAKYVALWNVDDVRHPESLRVQADYLDAHEDAVAVYGPFGESSRYGTHPIRVHEVNPRSPQELKSGMHLGPFFMFRRDVLGEIGGFDEQFMSAADYDFALRLANIGHIGHLSTSLGNFLNTGSGLSTSRRGAQPVERTAVELRHGLHSRVKARYLTPALRYDIGHRVIDGERVPAREAPSLSSGSLPKLSWIEALLARVPGALRWIDVMESQMRRRRRGR